MNERILVVGAGSAGMGVANTILSYAEEMCGMTREEARRLFWVTDNMVRRRVLIDHYVFCVFSYCHRYYCLGSVV